MKRIDALGAGRSERLAELTGKVLDSRLDPTLQAIVEDAARTLKTPIALVSLVLNRTQFFRAQTGLPEDLAVARATDRNASFCQFVVRDGARFEVNDAANDRRVPQELVGRYGIAAYLGEPVEVGGKVVGSLCAIDVVARAFSDVERGALKRLAAKASERLERLKTGAPNPKALSSVAGPAFGELRNALAALSLAAQAARVGAADLAPLIRIVEALQGDSRFPALEGLTQAIETFAQLTESVGDINEATRRVEHTLYALEALLVLPRNRVPVADVQNLATGLAHHYLKLVGGVVWEPVDPTLTIAAARSLAVSAIGMALGRLAAARNHSPPGIRGRTLVADAFVVIELWSDGLSSAPIAEIAAQLEGLFDPSPVLSFSFVDDRLCLHFARPSDP